MRIQIHNPVHNTVAIVEFSNSEFLPLFYLFPTDLLRKECPSLADMPRSVHGIFTQKEWVNKITSDYFLETICDLTACYVWPAFGISTYIECFSGYDPIWMLAHATGIWEQALEQMSGITPQGLANNPRREWRPAKLDEFPELMMRIGLHGIQEHNLIPIIQTVREMRCIEDYDARGSNAKTDFYRKWYHTRARFKTVSLDQLIESREDTSRNDAADAVLGDLVGDPAADFSEAVCADIDASQFYEMLTPRDREILQMRVDGHTYQEIADALQYKTHSAVLKRIGRIAEQYLDYADEQEGLREFLS
jgi:hypothetical protein